MNDQDYQKYLDSLPFCERCQQKLYGGSHYHCGGCDSTDTTGSYGHHSTVCHAATPPVNREFHHCGPNGDCELSNV